LNRVSHPLDRGGFVDWVGESRKHDESCVPANGWKDAIGRSHIELYSGTLNSIGDPAQGLVGVILDNQQ
jgi:hypothetical protein